MNKLLKLTTIVPILLLQFFAAGEFAGADPDPRLTRELLKINTPARQNPAVLEERRQAYEAKKQELDAIVEERGGIRESSIPKSEEDVGSIMDWPFKGGFNQVLYRFPDIETAGEEDGVVLKWLVLRNIDLCSGSKRPTIEEHWFRLANFLFDDGSSFTNMDLRIESKNLILSCSTLDQPILITTERFFENRNSINNCARRRQTLDWFTEAGFTFREAKDGVITVRRSKTSGRNPPEREYFFARSRIQPSFQDGSEATMGRCWPMFPKTTEFKKQIFDESCAMCRSRFRPQS